MYTLVLQPAEEAFLKSELKAGIRPGTIISLPRAPRFVNVTVLTATTSDTCPLPSLSTSEEANVECQRCNNQGCEKCTSRILIPIGVHHGCRDHNSTVCQTTLVDVIRWTNPNQNKRLFSGRSCFFDDGLPLLRKNPVESDCCTGGTSQPLTQMGIENIYVSILPKAKASESSCWILWITVGWNISKSLVVIPCQTHSSRIC